MKKCRICGTSNKDWEIVCKSCGAELPAAGIIICEGCGMEYDEKKECCPYCGEKNKELLISRKIKKLLIEILIFHLGFLLFLAIMAAVIKLMIG